MSTANNTVATVSMPSNHVGESQLNQNGLREICFWDVYDDKCHVLESTLASDDAIWLGLVGAARSMLLTREQIAALLPALQHFAETGRLPSPAAGRKA